MKQVCKTNENTVREFLSLIRFGLWGNTVPAAGHAMQTSVARNPGNDNARPDWKGILFLARKQALLPLLYDGMEYLPEDKRLQGHALMQLIAYVDKVENHNRALDEAAVEISSRLAAEGIRSVLLKGQGNAVLYRNPLHRQCGDIDLYVGAANYEKAVGIIRGWKEISNEKPESVKHVGFNYRDMVLELHREAYFFPDKRSNRLYRPWETEELNKDECHAILGEGRHAGKVTVPPVDFNLFYIFAHAFTHFMQSGLGLRQLCDLAVFIHRHHDEFDIEALQSRLKTFRLEKEWKLFICFLVEILGLPAEEAPLYDGRLGVMARRMLGRILADGNFGQHKNLPDFSRKPVLLRKIGNLGIHHIMYAQRLGFTFRYTCRYYWAMWRDGIKALDQL